jgi:MFS family permease
MLGALRYPQYRRFWFGNLAAVSGQQMMWLAQGWLVYDITGSALYLGYAGLATALPAILLNLVGGVLADRLDQRKVIFVTQVITGLSVLVLATLTALGLVHVWHVLVIAFISGATQAFNNPARQSIFPQLIDRSELMNAVSLNSIIWQGTRVVAPTAAGLIVAFAGTAFTFYLCALSFLPLGFIALTLKADQPTRQRRDSMLKDLSEGIGFIRDNFIFTFLIGMSFFNSFFGMAAQQLMPAFARDILDLGPSGLGLLFSASGVGSVLGMLAVGFLGDMEKKGVLLIAGATAYGALLILFALCTFYPLSLVLMFFTGGFSSVYMITLQTTLQLRVPDELRGRVMGVFGMTHNIGPLGALQAGVIADQFGAPVAVAISGGAIMSFALGVALARSEVRQLQAVAAPATA